MEQHLITPWDTRVGSEPTPLDWDMQVPPEVDAIAELVIKQYDMTVTSRTLITSKPDKGGAIWRIETDKGPRSLKLLHRNPERSLFSVGLQEYVVRQGARVPALIPANDGKLFVEMGGKLWIVTDWIDLTPATKVDLIGAQELCYGLGEFHRHSKGYVPPIGAKNSSRLHRWPNYYQKIAKKIGWMREMANSYRDTVASPSILAVVDQYEMQAVEALNRLNSSAYPKMVAMGEPHWGLVHQDYGWSNGQNGPGGLWVIDLDGVSYDLPFRDLRKLITSTMDDMGVWDLTWMRGMIDAYHQANPLDAESYEVLLIDMAVPNEFYKHLKEMFFDPITFLNTEAEAILQRVVATDQSKAQALAELASDMGKYKAGNYEQQVAGVEPQRVSSESSTWDQINWGLQPQMNATSEETPVSMEKIAELSLHVADDRAPAVEATMSLVDAGGSDQTSQEHQDTKTSGEEVIGVMAESTPASNEAKSASEEMSVSMEKIAEQSLPVADDRAPAVEANMSLVDSGRSDQTRKEHKDTKSSGKEAKVVKAESRSASKAAKSASEEISVSKEKRTEKVRLKKKQSQSVADDRAPVVEAGMSRVDSGRSDQTRKEHKDTNSSGKEAKVVKAESRSASKAAKSASEATSVSKEKRTEKVRFKKKQSQSVADDRAPVVEAGMSRVNSGSSDKTRKEQKDATSSEKAAKVEKGESRSTSKEAKSASEKSSRTEKAGVKKKKQLESDGVDRTSVKNGRLSRVNSGSSDKTRKEQKDATSSDIAAKVVKVEFGLASKEAKSASEKSSRTEKVGVKKNKQYESDGVDRTSATDARQSVVDSGASDKERRKEKRVTKASGNEAKAIKVVYKSAPTEAKSAKEEKSTKDKSKSKSASSKATPSKVDPQSIGMNRATSGSTNLEAKKSSKKSMTGTRRTPLQIVIDIAPYLAKQTYAKKKAVRKKTVNVSTSSARKKTITLTQIKQQARKKRKVTSSKVASSLQQRKAKMAKQDMKEIKKSTAKQAANSAKRISAAGNKTKKPATSNTKHHYTKVSAPSKKMNKQAPNKPIAKKGVKTRGVR